MSEISCPFKELGGSTVAVHLLSMGKTPCSPTATETINHKHTAYITTQSLCMRHPLLHPDIYKNKIFYQGTVTTKQDKLKQGKATNLTKLKSLQTGSFLH